MEPGLNVVFRNITWLESCTFLHYCMQCMVVLSDCSSCPGVVRFCALYGQCTLQNCYISVFVSHYVTSYELCLWPSVVGVAVYNEHTKGISLHCEHHICRNVKLFHNPQFFNGRFVHSLLNDSNGIVCYFVYWKNAFIIDKCVACYRTAQMCWSLCLVCALRCVWKLLT